MLRKLSRKVRWDFKKLLFKSFIFLLCLLIFSKILFFRRSIIGKRNIDQSRSFVDYKENAHDNIPSEVKIEAVPAVRGISTNIKKLRAQIEVMEAQMSILETDEYFSEDELKPWLKRPASDPSNFGENGTGIWTGDDEGEDVKRLIDEGYEKHGFNQYVCEEISLHRSLDDKREPECIKNRWRKPIPTTSVIIIFHNEAWCALLRTVYSVLETSPKVALMEVILVDDASTDEELGLKLDEYVKTLPVVKLIRLPERSGLVRARLVGAEAANGDVLTFLDSHCECSSHWLEPLLERIGEDPTRVVCPVIETIQSKTFAVSNTPARKVKRGVIDWFLEFGWDDQKNTTNNSDIVLLSPIMAGGLFSINKEYFYRMGSYDSEMKIWGGENIEMSLRIWMCGGSIEIHTCSHVGHVFRKRSSRSLPGGLNVVVRNSKRAAEVWMDDYKKEFYRRVPIASKIDAGDMTERIELRKRLGCRSFQWFLDNIYPELYAVPEEDIVKRGEWRNLQNTRYCMGVQDLSGDPKTIVGINRCHGKGGSQDFVFTKQGEIRHDYVTQLCLQPDGENVVTAFCLYPESEVPENQKWSITMLDQIKNIATERCLEWQNQRLILLPCEQTTSQSWSIKEL